MKNLRTIRIFLTVLLFAASVAYAFFSPPLHPMARIIPYTQIVPSMIAVSLGAIVFWIIVTLLLGRVYCSGFCPVGAIQDGVIALRRKVKGPQPTKHTGRFRTHSKIRYQLLLIYAVCLIAGFVAVPYFMEPWNIFCNIAAAVNADAVRLTWIRLGTGALTGFVAGTVSLIMIVIWAWIADRDYCNNFCPIGTLLGITDQRQVMHIEINPDKCINCMKCEEICPAGCIKVVSRYVDNARCVRCFDCTSVCPNNAIRYQYNRNRPATPLGHRVRKAGPR